MNERIQKLAEQAGYHPDVYKLCKPGMEKFAELIVRECAKIAYRVGADASDVSDCGDAILENFDLPYLHGVD